MRHALISGVLLLAVSGCLMSDGDLAPAGAAVYPFPAVASYTVFSMAAAGDVATEEGVARLILDADTRQYLYREPGHVDISYTFSATAIAQDLYILQVHKGVKIAYSLAVTNKDAVLIYTFDDWCEQQTEQRLATFDAEPDIQSDLAGGGIQYCRFQDFAGLQRAILAAYSETSTRPDYVLFEVPGT